MQGTAGIARASSHRLTRPDVIRTLTAGTGPRGNVIPLNRLRRDRIEAGLERHAARVADTQAI
jgi:hypothetical protein